MRYYYYEIILRANLASASDIVRLLILYQYGGVYIDVDTLPYTDNIFGRLNQYIEKEKIEEDDFLFLFKTKSILKKLSIFDFSDSDFLNNFKSEIETERNKYKKIQELIELDVAEFSLKKVLPLGEMYVHKNLLAIGSLRRMKGIYFNNFISSHPGSKVIKIILRTMRKRYKFLEKNNCIFDFYKGGEEVNYLNRILTWRTELITRDYFVTSVLSGPGLIIEVLLGLAYELLDFECETEPSFIAEYMQNDKFGIALFQHNLDTPDGICSSWRK
ncbi:Toxin A [compost metagenome]